MTSGDEDDDEIRLIENTSISSRRMVKSKGVDSFLGPGSFGDARKSSGFGDGVERRGEAIPESSTSL